MRNIWKNELKSKKLRSEVIIACIAFTLTSIAMSIFLSVIEVRGGVVLPDPVLRMFAPKDISYYTFIVIYSGVLGAFFYLLRNPRLLAISFIGYSFIYIFRMVSMWLAPLEAPAGIIVLKDPFVEAIAGMNSLTKDLFFSGHTATMFFLFLVFKNKWLKYSYLFGTFLIGFCVLIQQVHYSIDVYAAPFFAFASYKIAAYIDKRYFDE